jgi:hypothetical protein
MTASSSQPQSVTPSAVLSICGIEHHTLPGFNYSFRNFGPPQDKDDFGFDPPETKTTGLGIPITDSQPTLNGSPSLLSWRENARKDHISEIVDKGIAGVDLYGMGKSIVQSLPNPHTANSRYGQMTPPRSNLASSPEAYKNEEILPLKSIASRKCRQFQVKAEQVAPGPGSASPISTSSRKRKSTRKASRKSSHKASSNSDHGESLECIKRRQSLDKNRLAARKCRIKKQQRLEELQRASRDKDLENASLKDQVMRMKEKVQQMTTILFTHANSDYCRSPGEVFETLNGLANHVSTQHLSLVSQNTDDYPPSNFSDVPVATAITPLAFWCDSVSS